MLSLENINLTTEYAAVEDGNLTNKYMLLDAVAPEDVGDCTSCKDLKWLPSTNPSQGRTLDLSPRRRNRDHSEWFECERYLNPIYPAQEYRVVSMLAPPVLPIYRSSRETVDAEYQSTTSIEQPSRQSNQRHRPTHILPTPEPQNTPLAPSIPDPRSNLPSAAAITFGALSIPVTHPPEFTGIVQFASRKLPFGGPTRTTAGHAFGFPTAASAIDGISVIQATRATPAPFAAVLAPNGLSATVYRTLETSGFLDPGFAALSVGGPAYVVDGHIISLNADGIVLDGMLDVIITVSLIGNTAPTLVGKETRSASLKGLVGKKSGGASMRVPSFYLLLFYFILIRSFIFIL
jgi:hypothetical protein